MRDQLIVAQESQRPRLEPFRQGSLDGLCGLYATVNAIRLVVGPETDEQPERWSDLFGVLLRTTDALVGLQQAMTEGLKRKALVRIIEASLPELDAIAIPSIRLRRPFLHQLDWTDQDKDRLAWLMQESQTAVIGIVRRSEPHWTVLKEIERDQLTLFDSSPAANSGPHAPRVTSVDAVEPRSVVVLERDAQRKVRAQSD